MKRKMLRPPKAVYLSVGGFDSGYPSVLWRRGVLRYVPPMSQIGDPTNVLFTPSAEEWRWFAGRLRRIGVYGWAKSYSMPDVMDGTQWTLRINWPGQGRVWSDGSNEFPDGFQSLVNAVRKLTHGVFGKRV